ncbi:MAG: EamA family transporter [Gaiellales bacterium]|jgi:drug/metabolite transporter (DMT)-like permease
MAILLALASAAAYSIADFAGGVATRRAHVLRVVAISAPISLLVELALLPLLGGRWSTAAIVWGAVSGVGSAAAFVLLYQSLAIGPMSVVSPVTAVVSAFLPVLVGVLQGERLGVTALIGAGLATAAIVLVSTTSEPGAALVSRGALLLALGAGAAIALQLIALHQSPTGSGVTPLLAGRVVSGGVVLAAFLTFRRAIDPTRPRVALAALAGGVDALANLFFLFASHRGSLAIVALITALYPAGTVALARLLLDERLGRAQWIGLASAAVAVALLTVS